MYPFVRSFIRNIASARQPRIGFLDTSNTSLWVGPFDIDPWIELNNGRTLTLYDLGRLPHYQRVGVRRTIEKAGMYFTVAGVSVRYRARIRPFTKVDMHTRILGWDARFFYVDQSLWQDDVCANHMLLRQAIARRDKGIVPPHEVARVIGIDPASPELPEWVNSWIDAEATRPWPPDVSA